MGFHHALKFSNIYIPQSVSLKLGEIQKEIPIDSKNSVSSLTRPSSLLTKMNKT